MDMVLGAGNVDARYQREIEPAKNELRIRYVREQSYLLDIRILIETAFGLIGVRNITGLDISPKGCKHNE